MTICSQTIFSSRFRGSVWRSSIPDLAGVQQMARAKVCLSPPPRSLHRRLLGGDAYSNDRKVFRRFWTVLPCHRNHSMCILCNMHIVDASRLLFGVLFYSCTYLLYFVCTFSVTQKTNFCKTVFSFWPFIYSPSAIAANAGRHITFSKIYIFFLIRDEQYSLYILHIGI